MKLVSDLIFYLFYNNYRYFLTLHWRVRYYYAISKKDERKT